MNGYTGLDAKQLTAVAVALSLVGAGGPLLSSAIPAPASTSSEVTSRLVRSVERLEDRVRALELEISTCG